MRLRTPMSGLSANNIWRPSPLVVRPPGSCTPMATEATSGNTASPNPSKRANRTPAVCTTTLLRPASSVASPDACKLLPRKGCNASPKAYALAPLPLSSAPLMARITASASTPKSLPGAPYKNLATTGNVTSAPSVAGRSLAVTATFRRSGTKSCTSIST